MIVPALISQYAESKDLTDSEQVIVNQIKDALWRIVLDPSVDEGAKMQFLAAAVLSAWELGKRGRER
jgi:hypothetical protein